MTLPRFPLWTILLSTAARVHAAPVTLNAGGDAIGTSSFDNNGANRWSDGTDPAAGNDYSVATKSLRSPGSGDFSFAGDSLSLESGGSLLNKNAGPQTLTLNLILNGGYVRSGSGPADTLTLAGQITVTEAGGGLIPDQSPYVIESALSGTGGTLVVANSDAVGGFGTGTGPGRGITFNGPSTFTGNLQADATGVVLGSPSTWTFRIGAAGENNTISGTGTITLDGAFSVDLTGASAAPGDTWQLVQNATLTETYGPDFFVDGWTETPAGSGNWSSGEYTFSTATGALVYLPDSDGDGLTDSFEQLIIDADPGDAVTSFAQVTPTGDFDQDGLDNLGEQTAGTDPVNPDTDADGLRDGPEVNGTTNGNVAHGFGPTDPKDRDSDNDTLTDGEEVAGTLNTAFGNAASNPLLADGDADGFTDRYELEHATDPNDPSSLPAQPSGFTLIENFEGPEMVIGQTFSGLNGWSTGVAAAATVTEEPIAGSDRIGSFAHPAGIPDNFTSFYQSLSARGLQILEGNTGTVFLQIYSPAGGHDNSFGLSDVAAPGPDFNNFEAQFALRPGTAGNDLAVRDGGAIRDVGIYATGRWMNVWIVADNLGDTVRVYVESPEGQTGQVDVTPDTDVNAPFTFRNGTGDPLGSFFIIENAPDDIPVYFDNVCVNPVAADLSKPVADKPGALVDFRITAAGFDGSGNFTVSFAPGGSGFVLTSSGDLSGAFTPVAGAVDDSAGTFTVPAGSLRPGRDFFRVERAR